MKLALTAFVLLPLVATAKRSKKEKSSKSCSTFPKHLIELSQTDQKVPNGPDVAAGDVYLWLYNDLCEGDTFDDTKLDCGGDNVGNGSGSCLVLADTGESDCEDTWHLHDYGTLNFRGIGINEVVVGGTGCFENARGPVTSQYGTDGNDEWYNYDLTGVKL
mmetsp:Transcript_4941/g.6423  ORF Transcript_4941/g.6423 Transcript_4941/m.6423 type:complete len:161 (-) Transcript_4941:165-647(-)